MAIFLRFMTWRVGAEAPFPGWDTGVLRMAPLRNRTRLEFRSEYPATDSSQASPSDHCRSEEHTSGLQSLMRISYAVFCLKKKKYTRLTDEPDVERESVEQKIYANMT